jgi:low temperature requirement protein LtrA
MVEQHQAPRHGRVLWGVRPTGEDHRATTFELFFDLVYVFAATRVTGYMAHEHSGHGVLQGLLLLALLWWTWSGHGNWRLHSAGHWTERHGEFIILALGESVVAIGVGAATQPISTPLLLAAILGVAAVGLWWLYFDMASLAAEHRLLEAHGQARVRLALEAYTYGHFPVVAGIVLAALGIEGVLAHAGDNKPLGAFYALPLFGGVALYLAGQLLFQAPYAQAAEPATAGGDRRAPGRRASRRRPPTTCRAGRPGAHRGCPDRRRDHPVCADPTQPPRRIVPGQSTRLSACALRLASTK